MEIIRFDHIVLTVRDIEKTCEFYSRVLGMQVESYQNGRKALRFGGQKINLHEAGREFEPKAAQPTPGSADICFITYDPLDKVMADIRAAGENIFLGPVERLGAMGPIESVYLRDPDGNLIEIANNIH